MPSLYPPFPCALEVNPTCLVLQYEQCWWRIVHHAVPPTCSFTACLPLSPYRSSRAAAAPVLDQHLLGDAAVQVDVAAQVAQEVLLVQQLQRPLQTQRATCRLLAWYTPLLNPSATTHQLTRSQPTVTANNETHCYQTKPKRVSKFARGIRDALSESEELSDAGGGVTSASDRDSARPQRGGGSGGGRRKADAPSRAKGGKRYAAGCSHAPRRHSES